MAGPTIPIATLGKGRVTVIRLTRTSDGAGGMTTTETTLGTVPGRIAAVGGQPRGPSGGRVGAAAGFAAVLDTRTLTTQPSAADILQDTADGRRYIIDTVVRVSGLCICDISEA